MTTLASTDLGDAAAVLLLCPAVDDAHRQACTRLLVPERPGEARVLWVNYGRAPGDRVRSWERRAGTTPAEARVINVGDAARDAAGAVDARERLGSPGDLTGLSITVTEHLQEWREEPGEAVVCFDSVTALLQYTDVETAYEFLHVLTGRLYDFDATGHFHVDPAAHDDRTVAWVRSLFDAEVAVDAGEPAVRTA